MSHFEWTGSDGCVLAGFREEPIEGAKAVLCLIHGLGEHAGRYQDLTGVLTGRGIVVFSMDLRGHGLSDGKRGHVAPRALVLEDVDALIRRARQEYPGCPVWLMGHSLGGHLVLTHRLRGGEKVAGVVAASPWLQLVKAPGKVTRWMVRMLEKVVPSLTIRNGLDPADLSTVRHVGVDYRNDPLVHPFISMQTAMEVLRTSEEILARASEPEGRLLLMHGEADPICSVEASRLYAKKAGAGCRYREWPGMQHELHHEPIWPEEAELIADFVLDDR